MRGKCQDGCFVLPAQPVQMAEHSLMLLSKLQPSVCLYRWVEEVQGTKFDNYVDWLMMTYAFSLVDVPSLSIPCGLTSDNRPVGLQIVGRPNGDAAVLAAAAAFEKAHSYASMVPLQPIVKTSKSH